MSVDDMVTYSDPARPGMAFGRPPTRPGRPRGTPGPAARGDARADSCAAAAGPPTGRSGQEPALSSAQIADLRRRWGAVQAGFVDDPRRAVEVADDIVGEAVGAVHAAFDGRRRAAAEPWRGDGHPSTDALLAAFQRYRATFDQVLSV